MAQNKYFIDKVDRLKEPFSWQPSDEEKERFKMVMEDFDIGNRIMNKPYEEFNHKSVVQVLNEDLKLFNLYVPPRSQDPDYSWRAQTVRPILRNKLISIAGHITASVIVPNVYAQNKDDDEDKDAALVARDLIEWAVDNTGYPKSFIQAVIQALIAPATILESKYVESWKKVREMKANGEVVTKEVIDEVISGLKSAIVPVDELYISNIYEPYIQNQGFLIRVKKIQWHEAKSKYAHKENFKYVQDKLRLVFSRDNALFYQQYDKDLDGMVEEITYYNRTEDLKLVFVNGIIMSHPDNPIGRIDGKYPFSKGGYEPINEGRFFYYKSAASKLSNDTKTINTLYNMVLDGSFLSLMPPVAFYGEEELDSSVMVPGSMVNLNQEDKLETINPRSNLRSGLEALSTVESSVAESSQDAYRQGVMQGNPGRTAYEISKLDQNARIALGLFGKMIGFLVEDFGELMLSDIIQHMTVAQVDGVLSDNGKIRFRKFVIPDKVEKGKKVAHVIEFDTEVGLDPLKESFEILKRNGGYRNPKKKIMRVNPSLFCQLKFKLKVVPEEMLPPNKALDRALNLELYDRAIQNPLADQEAIFRDFLLESYKEGESDKYIKKQNEMMQGTEMPTEKEPAGVNQNMTGQVTGSNSLINSLLQG